MPGADDRESSLITPMHALALGKGFVMGLLGEALSDLTHACRAREIRE